MIARMVNAIPTANTNLAGFGFGAMDPLLAPGTLLVVLPRPSAAIGKVV
jgi:hypothetical protein